MTAMTVTSFRTSAVLMVITLIVDNFVIDQMMYTDNRDVDGLNSLRVTLLLFNLFTFTLIFCLVTKVNMLETDNRHKSTEQKVLLNWIKNGLIL